jgi:hypothetical protein
MEEKLCQQLNVKDNDKVVSVKFLKALLVRSHNINYKNIKTYTGLDRPG